MNTYRQLIYMCLDQLKLISDDSYYTEDHIMFLLDKCRTLLLNQKLSNMLNFLNIYIPERYIEYIRNKYEP
jgi:hypothetical protein